MIQNLVTAALNAIDVIMIGQMGETAVASVGLANQITFLANFLIFGITSGSAVFAAQFWGKRDVPSIRRVVGAAVLMSVGGALLFSVFAVGFPNAALSIYTEDSAVIELGGRYLSIVGFSYPFLAITLSFGSILRSSGRFVSGVLQCHCHYSENRFKLPADFWQTGVPGNGDPWRCAGHIGCQNCRNNPGSDPHLFAADPGGSQPGRPVPFSVFVLGNHFSKPPFRLWSMKPSGRWGYRSIT